MNILVVTTEIGSEGGGMAIACQKIVSILSEDHHVDVLSSCDYPIDTACSTSNWYSTAIRKEYKLKQDTLKYDFADVVIGFGGRFNGYYASLLAERIGKRFILALRGSDINIIKWSIEDAWYLRESCHKASKIVSLSNEMSKNVLSIIPESNGKIVVIPNEIGEDFSEVLFPNIPHSVHIGCAAAHINEKKGISNLLNMLYEFHNITCMPIDLDVVGAVDEDLRREYSTKCKQLGLWNDVHFIGYKSREELRRLIQEWDFYVQASVCEGHPNAVLEALQTGTGFISTRTGFIAEMLQEDFPKFFFRSWNPKGMATDLLHLIELGNKVSLYKEAYLKLSAKCNKSLVRNLWKGLFSYNRETMYNVVTDNIVAVALHDVQGEIHDNITTPIGVFREFVEYIHESGHGLCSMKAYLAMREEERKKWIVCTFDDGYKSLVEVPMKILSQHGFSATVFVCTGLIGKDNSWNNKDAKLRQHLDYKDIESLVKAGWEIASHGVMHKNLLKLSDIAIDYELKESKDFLQRLVGYADTYAYPYGSNNKFIRRCVEKYYKYAFAVDCGGSSLSADSYQLKRYSITEIYKMLNK